MLRAGTAKSIRTSDGKPLLTKKKEPITLFIALQEVCRTAPPESALIVSQSDNMLVQVDQQWRLYRFTGGTPGDGQDVLLPKQPAKSGDTLYGVMGGAKQSSSFLASFKKTLLTGKQALGGAAAVVGGVVGAGLSPLMIFASIDPVTSVQIGASVGTDAIADARASKDRIDAKRAASGLVPIVVDVQGWATQVTKLTQIELDPATMSSANKFYRVVETPASIKKAPGYRYQAPATAPPPGESLEQEYEDEEESLDEDILDRADAAR